MSGVEDPLPLRIRRATEADLRRLAELEAECFADPWPASLLRDELDHAGGLVLVGERGAAAPAAGYACFRLGAGEAELLRVAVEPEARGRGAGTALVAAGLAEMRRAGATRCHLEVRPGNASAHALYRRLGFALAGRRPGYYRDGGDALVFSLALAPAEALSTPSARLDPA